jgi:Fusaric acid resistance protein-like
MAFCGTATCGISLEHRQWLSLATLTFLFSLLDDIVNELFLSARLGTNRILTPSIQNQANFLSLLGIGLEHSAWAVTASTYTISGSLEGTTQRVVRRIVGTSIDVPLAIAWLPIAADAPLVIWAAAGLAMIIYAMPCRSATTWPVAPTHSRSW